ncbi:unnamed protein product [Leptidea sinapis]|uniref:Uncharacterized protein n=1 Tax=Leptidea sinapis TaxID=189913 RepID=A0A5E4R8D5_9NEOP|nr:unnamed protein product [Leptidea sinapis]
MAFLLPFMANRNTTAAPVGEYDTNESPAIEMSESGENSTQQKKRHDYHEDILKMMKARTQRTEKNDIDLFFSSIAETVKKFPKLEQVNEQSLKALNILLCGIGSLYMWVQCLLTTYLSTLYYDKRLTVCRLCLANVSFLFLVVLALFGTVSVFLPTDSSSGIYMCNIIASISSYVMTTIFCTFILSYEKEYKYFSEGIRSDMLIDDACSLNNASLDDVDSILRTEEPTSSTNATKRRVPCAVLS